MVVNRVSTWSSMVVILRRPRKLANTLMVQTITKVKSLFLVVAKKSVKSTSLIVLGGHLVDTPSIRLRWSLQVDPPISLVGNLTTRNEDSSLSLIDFFLFLS